MPLVDPDAVMAETTLLPVKLAVDTVEEVASLRLRVKALVVMIPLPFSLMEKAELGPSGLAVVKDTV